MASTIITLIIAILLLQAYITIAAYYLGRAEGYDQAKNWYLRNRRFWR